LEGCVGKRKKWRVLKDYDVATDRALPFVVMRVLTLEGDVRPQAKMMVHRRVVRGDRLVPVHRGNQFDFVSLEDIDLLKLEQALSEAKSTLYQAQRAWDATHERVMEQISTNDVSVFKLLEYVDSIVEEEVGEEAPISPAPPKRQPLGVKPPQAERVEPPMLEGLRPLGVKPTQMVRLRNLITELHSVKETN